MVLSVKRAAALLVAALPLAGLVPGCQRAEPVRRPNVIWILWDTVRADRLSLLGYARPTTPHLARFAERARVFENCLSTAGTTVPAHASMFTDLLPTEFEADNVHCFLNPEFVTLPEIFQQIGYRTFLYSENPYISVESGFGGGFDRVVHPWSPAYRQRAARLMEGKIPPAWRSPQLAGKLRDPNAPVWALSACGTLGETALTEWLAKSDRRRPVFAFLNYMEAHAPVVTPEQYRAQMMSRAEIDRSYAMGLTPAAIWQYTFGVSDYSAADLAVIGKTYDAALRELDDLFEHLLVMLRERRLLDDTILVVTSDHGEYLGEHHLLDHQYFLYRQVLEVPLVLYYPGRVPPGRETRPVMNMDLYPTLLELTGVPAPPRKNPFSVSLLRPPETRTRVAASRTQPEWPFAEAKKIDPAFDPAPYRRGLLALRQEPYSFLVATTGRQELYDLAKDPDESHDLFAQESQVAGGLADELSEIVSARMPAHRGPRPEAALTPEQKAVLRSLGYLGGAD